MPAHTAKRGGKIRVVEPSGRIARARKKGGKKGKARDGGGYPNTPAGRKKAAKLVGAMNRKYWAKGSPRKRRGR
jgi:hypothetical protein